MFTVVYVVLINFQGFCPVLLLSLIIYFTFYTGNTIYNDQHQSQKTSSLIHDFIANNRNKNNDEN